MSIPLAVLVLILSIAGFAVINGVEIAIVGANRLRIRHLAESGSKSARALLRLQNEQDRFFSAVVVVQNMLVFASALVSEEIGAQLLGDVGRIYVLLFTLGGAVLTAFFGELVPKVLASQASESFALMNAVPAEALTRLLTPVVKVLSYILGFISRAIFGREIETGPSVTEAELRMLIESSAEQGAVDEAEAELLDRVFHFGDRSVHEVMVPRTEMVVIPQTETIAGFYAVYSQHPHSRFPVVDGGPDSVVGTLGIKDVLAGLAEGRVDKTSPLQPLMRQPFFVPETKAIGELMREMQQTGNQMAVAIDEFGGTAGIVTLEGLLEEMVGPLGDELHPSESEVQEIDERTIQFDGSLSIEDAREELEIDLPEGPYDTMAGFVLERMGRIPDEGDKLELEDGNSLEVVEMKGPKIESLRLTKAS